MAVDRDVGNGAARRGGGERVEQTEDLWEWPVSVRLAEADREAYRAQLLKKREVDGAG